MPKNFEIEHFNQMVKMAIELLSKDIDGRPKLKRFTDFELLSRGYRLKEAFEDFEKTHFIVKRAKPQI